MTTTDIRGLDLAQLAALADSLPGPHAWAWGADDIFYCQACSTSFVWGEPVPEGVCDPDDHSCGGISLKVGDEWLDLDDFIARYGRDAAERRLAPAGMMLGPAYDDPAAG